MDATERDEILIAGWDAGLTLGPLASRTGCSISWVSRRARKLGLKSRSRSFSAGEVEFALTAYRNGRTIAGIAADLGRSHEATRRVLVKAGMRIASGAERARRWPVDHFAFAAPLSAEAWYWIGFLAADGNVHGTRLSLGLSPSSENALRRFQTFLACPEKPIRLAARGRQLVADVHSPQLVRDLASHGVVPRKTWGLEVSAAAAAEPAFWLGNLDGDGSVMHDEAGVPRLAFVGAKPVMDQCADFLADRILDHRPKPGPHAQSKVIWLVRVSGDNARRVAAELLDAHPESLEVKRAKLERAAAFRSARTDARAAVRRRRCEWCGAWIERFPSQTRGARVFCNPSHAAQWRCARIQFRGALDDDFSEATIRTTGL
jgi:hypothetical protein